MNLHNLWINTRFGRCSSIRRHSVIFSNFLYYLSVKFGWVDRLPVAVHTCRKKITDNCMGNKKKKLSIFKPSYILLPVNVLKHRLCKTQFWKNLFAIRFPFKQCNFWPLCPPIEMALKTVIRPIENLTLKK